MATVQKLPVSTLSTASSYASRPAGGQGFSEQFPAGLRVLVVDDDTICLKILEQMLRKCLYQVTTCCRATIALSLLRERKGGFDVVISDVHMPDMDGFKLLEHVGLEMDLPVIMMSADGRTNVVMKGIKHGACDYLIKPVRIEELKNIWQHVIRKRWNGNKEIENSGSIEDTERQNRRVRGDEGEYASSVNEGTDGSSWKAQKKRKDSKEEEDDGELDSDDPSSSKKPRVVWSVELHQQFVGAVNQLGIEKAVPKRILELMNVPGLTRENVASHLQKFRLYLKRLSGVNPHSGGIPSPFCGPLEPDSKLGPLGRLDFHALAASGQIAPQTLAALQVELLGHPTGCRLLPGMDPPLLLQTSQQGPNCISLDHRGPLAFGQPLVKYPPNVLNQFPQSIQDISSGFTMWTNQLDAGPSSNVGSLNSSNNNMVQMLQKPQPVPESSSSINVQPSCLIVPSQTLNDFHLGNNLGPGNQAHPSNRSSKTDYSLISSQSNNPTLRFGQVAGTDFRNIDVLTPGVSTSPSVSSSSVRPENNTGLWVSTSSRSINPANTLKGFSPNSCKVPLSKETRTGGFPDQGLGRSLGFVGKGTSIPSRFAADDIESPTSERAYDKISMDGNMDIVVKQEPSLDNMESAKVGIPVGQYFAANDFMSVLSK